MFKISFDIIKIDSVCMIGIIKICTILAAFSIIYRVIKSEVQEINLDEGFLVMAKFVFYSLLAGYIYLIVKKNKFPEIDVLTFLTFLLACFEATHNFMNFIGNGIACILRLIFRR